LLIFRLKSGKNVRPCLQTTRHTTGREPLASRDRLDMQLKRQVLVEKEKTLTTGQNENMHREFRYNFQQWN